LKLMLLFEFVVAQTVVAAEQEEVVAAAGKFR
jgi:hypothetical protein